MKKIEITIKQLSTNDCILTSDLGNAIVNQSEEVGFQKWVQ